MMILQNFLQLLRFNKSFKDHNLELFVAHESTSNTIKDFLSQITNKHIDVIPFGVDTSLFCKKEVASTNRNQSEEDEHENISQT